MDSVSASSQQITSTTRLVACTGGGAGSMPISCDASSSSPAMARGGGMDGGALSVLV